jgi:hypothetical protein
MATISSICPRCRQRRPLFLVPIKGPGPIGQRTTFLCVGCSGDMAKHDMKPKVVQK